MTLVIRSLCLSLAMLALCAGPATAKSKNQAEVVRLSEEMQRLAQRTAWSGVVRTYRQVLKLRRVEVKADIHFLGSQAAAQQGDVDLRIEALTKAGSRGASELRVVYQNYGSVKLTKGKKKTLKPAEMPFAPDQRAAIETAQRAIKAKGKFKGWLPKGTYTLGAATFTVKATKKRQKFKGK